MTSKKKRYKPWFWRRRDSCPDCGWTERNNEECIEHLLYNNGIFECPRCKTIYSPEDFYEDYENKYSYKIDETEFN